ncbi:hypothetical protein ACFYSC_19430 [Streptosporangium sp. NPDC004379]|uniref:SH3 domain-containing protein n=1 Tax=Streptosporangium sp. NPDC004379 TaxID=3366189 RepID=UPI00369052D4
MLGKRVAVSFTVGAAVGLSTMLAPPAAALASSATPAPSPSPSPVTSATPLTTSGPSATATPGHPSATPVPAATPDPYGGHGHSTDGSGHTVLACTYRVTGVRADSYLNVRSRPSLAGRRIGRLTVADGAFAGSCSAAGGWVEVKASNGRLGWASARYLRKVDEGQSPSDDKTPPGLTCNYRVVKLQPGGYLNVRSRPAADARRVGRLTPADIRFAGGCSAVKGWVAVRASNGKLGWASARYLHKVT